MNGRFKKSRGLQGRHTHTDTFPQKQSKIEVIMSRRNYRECPNNSIKTWNFLFSHGASRQPWMSISRSSVLLSCIISPKSATSIQSVFLFSCVPVCLLPLLPPHPGPLPTFLSSSISSFLIPLPATRSPSAQSLSSPFPRSPGSSSSSVPFTVSLTYFQPARIKISTDVFFGPVPGLLSP